MFFAGAVMVALGVGCNDSKPDPAPVDVAFTIYSLEGTSSQWTNLKYGDFFVIDSDEVLSRYISGTDYLPVDFSKKTLLLVGTGAPYQIWKTTSNLLQVSPNGYRLDIEIFQTGATSPAGVILAIIVDKLSAESDVELNVVVLWA